MIEYFTPMFFIQALFSLGIGICVLVAGHPLLLNGHWFLRNAAIALSPIAIVSLMQFSNFQVQNYCCVNF